MIDPFSSEPLTARPSLALPKLGYGAAPLGSMNAIVNEEESWQALSVAWERGVRLFDTAPWYGLGLSEHRIGRYLASKPREEFLVSTKVGRVLRASEKTPYAPDPWLGGLPFDVNFDYSYDGIMRSFEDSLQRLGLASIDMLVIHDLDNWYHAPDLRVQAYLDQLSTSGWRALDDLRRDGVIEAVGAGINELGMIPRFLELVDLDFVIVAMQYTLACQGALEFELPACQGKGVDVLIGSPFQSGILVTGAIPGARFSYAEATTEQLEHVREIEAVCNRHGVPLQAAALQFPLAHPAVRTILPGFGRSEHVDACLTNLAVDIPVEFWQELKEHRLLALEAPVPC